MNKYKFLFHLVIIDSYKPVFKLIVKQPFVIDKILPSLTIESDYFYSDPRYYLIKKK